MEIKELRTKTLEELKGCLLDLLQERFNLRMQKGMDEVSRPHLYKQVRRAIARVKTLMIMRQREQTDE